MEDSPLVSVLMTSFNRERYIAEAIESVLNQTYQNFELIIVDDCSVDKTVAIATEYQLKDARIKLFINQQNLGDYPNRNKAASYAKGKYLKYLDADDLLYPHGLFEMVSAIDSFPEAAFGLQCPTSLIASHLPMLLYPKDAFFQHYFMGGVFLSGPSGAIIRKDIFDKMGGFSGKRFIGDTELWLTLGMDYPVVLFSASLIWWREHDEQEIKYEKKSFDPVLDRFFLDKKIILDPKFPLDSPTAILLLKKTNRRFLVNLLNFLLKTGRLRLWLSYLKKSNLSFSETLKAIFH